MTDQKSDSVSLAIERAACAALHPTGGGQPTGVADLGRYRSMLREVERLLRRWGTANADERAMDIVHRYWASGGFRLALYDRDRPLKPYDRATARYLAIGSARNGRRTAVAIDGLDVAAPATGIPDCEAAERERAVNDAVERLSERYRTAIQLRYWDGLSSARIGEMLGVPATTVDVWLFRARRLLRHRLAELAP
jgi:RNA polymerase sigma-70 factor (ECF subfamily)